MNSNINKENIKNQARLTGALVTRRDDAIQGLIKGTFRMESRRHT